MLTMANTTKSNDRGELERAVETVHSLDDSENISRSLHNDPFFNEELDGLFHGDDHASHGGAPAGAVGIDPDSMEPESHSRASLDGECDAQPDRQSSGAQGIPSTITTVHSTKTAELPKPKLKRRNSKMEGENRGLPPPSWHSEAADKHHRQQMILDMYVHSGFWFLLSLQEKALSLSMHQKLTVSIPPIFCFSVVSVPAYYKVAKRKSRLENGCASYHTRHASWRGGCIGLPLRSKPTWIAQRSRSD